MANSQLPMSTFSQCATSCAIDLHPMMQERPMVVCNAFNSVMDLVAKGRFRIPKTLTVFKISEVEEVFRRFQGGRHYGKMAVILDENALVQVGI